MIEEMRPPISDADFDDDFEAKLEKQMKLDDPADNQIPLTTPKKPEPASSTDQMSQASATLLLGDRNRKDILELFVQNFLLSLKKSGGVFSNL